MNDSLRVALIASSRFAVSQPFAGGLEAHVWHLARALAKLGHRVSLFAAAGSDGDLDCRTLAVRPLGISRIARADVSMPAEGFMADHHAYLTLMLRLAESGRDDFDIVHNHSLHYLPVAMAPMLSIPMLTTVHTPPTPWLESAIDASAGVGTQFAAVSEHTARSWSQSISRITVIPNGIDTRRWPLGPGGGPLVWFGRITAEKAPHLAISAARRAGKPLVLAGPISDTEYFATEVAPRLGADVRYAGHLDQDQLARVVGAAEAALVTPVWDEPYGLVVAEAMCCGTPVVAFARGGIPELVGPESGRLVAGEDVGEMADAIPAAVGLRRSGVREYAIGRCSLEAMLGAYLDVYRRMVDNPSEAKHDRLLRPSSRFWSLGAGGEHLPSPSPTGDGADFAECRCATPVHGGGELTA
ncbi:glycosyltransferase family 4 protein [Mycobacterium sherrisii]|uniref:Glycosyl transferase family 1 n=1 Tax=Mycobacterium sherrisii TaxID=243061 RepID=A0A1E3SE19_9MYCO|nr:glycosyltransferase family 4 protein [Mycobacterium sherrisii]MCV7031966.1 glycosyltransferase family 4 protein [Mycobacterium sherrisii]ODQ99817.1 glycosyl transferase family 1 [Mycobacterium sherrisii]ORW76768.1 glycosyl transferase family 1 [Mycobacterium sherrisii]